MVGVSIAAVNMGTQDTYSATTNPNGDYTIEFVKVGTYRIMAKHPGFESFTKDGITVEYNQTVRTDFTLPVGQNGRAQV